MRFSAVRLLTGAIALLSLYSSVFAVGQSAVITLVFPPGARATGLGEAFTGLADDANATYFNPAGLGQDPLSNSWKIYSMENGLQLTAIAAKRKKDFGMGDKIWAGTNHGILQFNGKAWIAYERHLIVQGDNLESIAKKYLAVDNESLINRAVMVLKNANGIEVNRTKGLEEYLRREISDSLMKAKNYTIDDLTAEIMALSKFERTSAQIYGKIAVKVDSLKASKMADDIAQILTKKDTQFEELVELKVPFKIAVDDTVRTLLLDSLDRVWVGTPHGLWRYDGSVWKYFSESDGLPSNSIRALCVGRSGDIAVGTDAGIGIFADGKWTAIGVANGLPDPVINAVAYGKNGVLYVGTAKGLAARKDSAWTFYDTTNGLLTNDVRVLFVDSKSRLWVGGPNGVAIFDEATWRRYKFPGSTVTSISEHSSGTVWIGTNKGAITYRQGRIKTDASGKTRENPPEWKVYHSKNALKGDDVQGVSVQGNDMWLATKEAVNKYDYADRQVFLFHEMLLPAFKIPDLWHVYLAGVLPTEDWGTIGVTVNFINFGVNTSTDEQGREIAEYRSWEGVFGLSYGLLLAPDFSAGINIKYAHSALAPGYGPGDEGVGQTFAIDAALLKKNLFVKNLSLGFMLQNMGPSIFYISQQEADPIPFTVRLGLAYKAVQTPFLDLNLLLDVDREIVKNYPDKQPDPFYTAIWTGLLADTTETTLEKLEDVNLHAGIELWYANLLALRIGHLFDYTGKRFELTFGLGINYANIIFDWSFIYSPEGFMKGIVADGSTGARNGQWRWSLMFNF
ncbi:MAG TPA: PorV/PorQ family protein [Chitinivibrionales bacterium]|nr:PorV/PorQ family protein [Chitinivibrionales bacterium]